MVRACLQDGLSFLSEGIVLALPSNLPHLASLHEALEEVGRQLPDDADTRTREAVDRSARLVEAVILREVEDADAALAQVAQLIAFMQAVLIDGRPIDSLNPAPATVGYQPPSPPLTPHHHPPASVEVMPGTRQGVDDLIAAITGPGPTAAEQVCLTESSDVAQSFRLCGDSELTIEFIGESREHLEGVDVSLLLIERDGGDAEALNAVFRAFHTIKGVAGFLELGPIRELAHESETLLDRCRKGELALRGGVLDVVFDATDAMKALVASVEAALASDRVMQLDGRLPALVERIRVVAGGGSGEPSQVPTARESQATSPTTRASAHANAPTTDTTARTGDAQMPAAAGQLVRDPATHVEDAEPPRAGVKALKESIRVDADRLDKLVDLIGEMVIAEAMVSQGAVAAEAGAASLGRRLGHLDKITRELQELAMSLRMVPVRSTFQRMARLARDVAKKLGKPIDFVTTGDETELDKNVVDAIGDPLVHMIRNAVDHGLECSPADRAAAGKAPTGRIELRAFHKGGSIHIEIEDDGRGLDRELILAKARERGMTKDGESLSDAEVFALIFEPGFSTAKQVTDLSGRGVGLDVVRRNIHAMRGKIEIHSEKGRGSVFSIHLPLTLAIIEGMVVRLARQRFIVPTLSIVRMVRPDERHTASVFQRCEMLRLGDQLIPLHRLDRLFGFQGPTGDASKAAVLIVEHDNRRVGFLVDELLGQQQVVIKPLGALLRKTPGFSGGAILPDGKVGLILDVAGLTALADRPQPGLAA